MPQPITNPQASAEGVKPLALEDRLKAYLDRDKTPATEEDTDGDDHQVDLEVDEDDDVPLEVPGDESDDDEDEVDDSEDLPPEFWAKKVKATVNGEEVLITVDEAAKGYQRNQDYTRKSQEVARTREVLMGNIEQYKKGIEVIATLMAQEVDAYKQVDWEGLKASDPPKYAVMKLEAQEANQRFQQLQATWQAASHQQASMSQEEMAGVVQEENKKLLQKIPEWKDEAKQAELKKAIAKFAVDEGFTIAELEGVTDHRYLVILNKARKFDELMRKQGKLSGKKISDVKAKVKKGSNDPQSNSERQLRTAEQLFIKRKDMDSAAQLLKQRLVRSK